LKSGTFERYVDTGLPLDQGEAVEWPRQRKSAAAWPCGARRDRARCGGLQLGTLRHGEKPRRVPGEQLVVAASSAAVLRLRAICHNASSSSLSSAARSTWNSVERRPRTADSEAQRAEHDVFERLLGGQSRSAEPLVEGVREVEVTVVVDMGWLAEDGSERSTRRPWPRFHGCSTASCLDAGWARHASHRLCLVPEWPG